MLSATPSTIECRREAARRTHFVEPRPGQTASPSNFEFVRRGEHDECFSRSERRIPSATTAGPRARSTSQIRTDDHEFARALRARCGVARDECGTDRAPGLALRHRPTCAGLVSAGLGRSEGRRDPRKRVCGLLLVLPLDVVAHVTTPSACFQLGSTIKLSLSPCCYPPRPRRWGTWLAVSAPNVKLSEPRRL